MDRRKFLRGSVAGLVPLWLSCAFRRAQDFDPFEKRVNDHVLARSYQQAQKLGKPLLVIVATKENYRERQFVFGEFFNYGGRDLWPLALCEVVCATKAEISTIVSVEKEPLFYLLEDDQGAVKATPFDTNLPSWIGLEICGIPEPDDEESMEELKPQAAQIVEQRISLLGTLVRQSLAIDTAMIQSRAALVQAALPEEASTADTLLKEDKLTYITLADRFAALVALYASNVQQEKLFALLASAAESRVRRQRIPGSRWGASSGCGTDFEDATKAEKSRMVDCGLGYIPEKSARFLWFYTKVG
jgi:hypothetical protein